MGDATKSYAKATLASFVGAGAIVVATAIEFWFLSSRALDGLAIGATALGAIAAAALTAVGISGLVVSQRAARIRSGAGDWFSLLNGARSEQALAPAEPRTPRMAFRAVRRLLTSPKLVAGDAVRVNSLDQIRATLDASGCLDGLPFMPEMEHFCGRIARIYRVADKVYDYGGKKDLRAIRETVVLVGLRCDGGEHDGCQAGCYLLWKSAWLTRLSESEVAAHRVNLASSSPSAPVQIALRTGGIGAAPSGSPPAPRVYTCQYTQLVAASTPIRANDIRPDLRPLVAGNVTLRAFLVVIATRLFNSVQKRRGGAGFPILPRGAARPTQSPSLGLRAGDRVRVRSVDEIARTLNASGKNLGLWFDGDMVKHVGQTYRVHSRIERIIDDASGHMLIMKHPCIVLDGVHGSGEFLRLNAQHDYIFWRESWLERVEEPGGPTATPRPAQPANDP